MSAQAVFLFDIDGTIMRGAGFQHRDALIEGVRRITGVTTSFDGIDTAGRLDRDLIVALARKTGYSDSQLAAQLPDLVEACRQAWCEDCEGDLRHCVLPGVREFIERAAEHEYVLGVVSGNLRLIGRKKLERAGLLHYFAVSGFSEDGHTRAELARLAADEARDQHGVDEWSPVFLIGDHFNDVQAARTNCFHSVAVATGVLSLQQLQTVEPTLAVADLRALDPSALVAEHRGS